MVADAVARAHRLMGDDVFFLTGTDEHGQKVERAAQKSGLTAPVFADQVAAKFADLLPAIDSSNDSAGTDIARSGEIAPQRNESKILVEAPPALLSCDEGGLPRSIDKKATRHSRPRSVLFGDHNIGSAAAVRRETLGAQAPANANASISCVVEQ